MKPLKLNILTKACNGFVNTLFVGVATNLPVAKSLLAKCKRLLLKNQTSTDFGQ